LERATPRAVTVEIGAPTLRPVIAVRPLTVADAPALAAAYLANWSFLAPWEPVRDEQFFTVEGQRDRLRQAEDERQNGRRYACAIELDAALAGTITLSGITRGAAQCAYLGYWVAKGCPARS
jgi:ribosomal-protein-alanine N-acetyltransferase